jgi:hypothetical protein
VALISHCYFSHSQILTPVCRARACRRHTASSGAVYSISNTMCMTFITYKLCERACAPPPCARACATVDSYGGGDDIRFSRTIACLELPLDRLPAPLPRRIEADVAKAYASLVAVPEARRVARVPAAPLPADLHGALRYCYRFTIVSHVST